MLTIDVAAQEFYDERAGVFYYSKPVTVKLEHSLISVAKWEAEWKKAYMPSRYQEGIKGYSEEVSYISSMIIGFVEPYVPTLLYQEYRLKIKDYIADPQSATVVYRTNKQVPSSTVTAEIIYYWMIQFNIPFECEKWHLNRLLTLIDVCNVKQNGKKDRMSALEVARNRHEINKKRLGVQ